MNDNYSFSRHIGDIVRIKRTGRTIEGKIVSISDKYTYLSNGQVGTPEDTMSIQCTTTIKRTN